MDKYRLFTTESPVYHPQENFPEDKGLKDGHCNRSSCLQPDATWFNHSTRKWYCQYCAHLINRANPEFKRETGSEICIPGDEIDS